MTTNQERAAEIIATATIPPGTSIRRGMDRAILATKLLAGAGLLMPDLSEPYSHESFTSWLLNGDVGVKVNPRCAVIIEHMDVGWFALPPEDASRFADMIKAAANHAEQEQDNV